MLKYLFSVHGEPEHRAGQPVGDESVNNRFRDELLERELFTSLTEAQVLVEAYRIEHSHERPHGTHGVWHNVFARLWRFAPDSLRHVRTAGTFSDMAKWPRACGADELTYVW